MTAGELLKTLPLLLCVSYKLSQELIRHWGYCKIPTSICGPWFHQCAYGNYVTVLIMICKKKKITNVNIQGKVTLICNITCICFIYWGSMFKFHDLKKKVKGAGGQDPWVAVLTLPPLMVYQLWASVSSSIKWEQSHPFSTFVRKAKGTKSQQHTSKNLKVQSQKHMAILSSLHHGLGSIAFYSLHNLTHSISSSIKCRQ